MLIPKQAFLDHGVFDVSLRCTQDYELWHKMLRTFRPVHLPKVLASTRCHGKQTTNTSTAMVAEGNALYINLIRSLSKAKAIRLEGSEYNFFSEMESFLKSTPYREAELYCSSKIASLRAAYSGNKKSTPLVSIIIPFYNRIPETLRAIKSAQCQTYTNTEIILINDGSTDSASDIETLTDAYENIRLIKSHKNFGPSHARNIGISAASGKYIAFLDSDDEFLPEKISKQLDLMLLSNDNMSHTSYTKESSNKEEVVHSGRQGGNIARKLMYQCSIATPTVMIKKEYLVKNLLKFNENISCGEDICLWLTIIKDSHLGSIDEPLTIVHTSSTSSAYDTASQILGLKNILTFLLSDQYYSSFDPELANIMSAFAAHTRAHYGGNADPNEFHGNLIVRNIKKVKFYISTEGFGNTIKRSTRKIRKKIRNI
jgi:glycosyltransferase involved in cell wall biosynthesis